MIIDHNDPRFQALVNQQSEWRRANRWNGGVYYSMEIVQNIIPRVNTDRNWVTVDLPMHPEAFIDHSIAFVHHNINTHWYEQWRGKDVILVCGMPETVDKVKQYGKAIYLPLSVDVEYVTRFRAVRKTKDTCFVGRPVKRTKQLPAGIDYLQSMPRELLLTELAQYEKAYAVDRCAIEAKILDCEVLDYGYNYGVPHPPDFWEIIDNSEAAEMLNVMVRNIDG